jgi:hypothetical protein
LVPSCPICGIPTLHPAGRTTAKLHRQAFAYDRDLTVMRSLMAKSVRIVVPGPDAIPFCGEFHGFDGFQEFLDKVETAVAYERPYEVTEVRASGNLVVMSGKEWLKAIPTGKTFTSHWQHVYEFENGRLVRLDDWDDTFSCAEAFQKNPG